MGAVGGGGVCEVWGVEGRGGGVEERVVGWRGKGNIGDGGEGGDDVDVGSESGFLGISNVLSHLDLVGVCRV